MPHENSETIKSGSDWYNILGYPGPSTLDKLSMLVTGKQWVSPAPRWNVQEPLAQAFPWEKPFYASEPEASAAAKRRSNEMTPQMEYDPIMKFKQYVMPMLQQMTFPGMPPLRPEETQGIQKLNRLVQQRYWDAMNPRETKTDLSEVRPELYEQFLKETASAMGPQQYGPPNRPRMMDFGRPGGMPIF